MESYSDAGVLGVPGLDWLSEDELLSESSSSFPIELCSLGFRGVYGRSDLCRSSGSIIFAQKGSSVNEVGGLPVIESAPSCYNG